MKKRILSIFLTLAMALTLLPATALAADTQSDKSVVKLEINGEAEYFDLSDTATTAKSVLYQAWGRAQSKTAKLTLLQTVDLGASNLVMNSGEVTLTMAEGVTLSGSGSNVIVANGGILAIDGGVISSSNSSGYCVETKGGTVNITGGTLSGRTCVQVSTGALYVSGGAINGTRYAVSNRAGTTTILDGANITGGSSGVMAGGGTVEINGGSVSGAAGGSSYGVTASGGTVKVFGGTISGGKYGLLVTNAAVELSGGTYSGGTGTSIYCNAANKNLDEYLVDGYAYQLSDNTWSRGFNLTALVGAASVKRIPVQVTGPNSVTVAYNTAATIRVTATPTTEGSEITYQWYQVKDGVETPIEGADAASYSPALPIDSGVHSFYCAVTCEGYTVESEIGTITVADQGRDYVAAVTIDGASEYYETLPDAWAAADGQRATVALLQDVEITDALTLTGGDVTFYAENYTLTGTGTNVLQVKGGKLTLTSGTIRSNTTKSSGYVIYAQGGTVTIAGASIVCDKSRSVGVYVTSTGTVVMRSGSISGTAEGIHANGKVTLYGGSIHGDTHAVFVADGMANSLLADGYVYQLEDGSWTEGKDAASIAGTVSIYQVPMQLVSQTTGTYRTSYDKYVAPHMEVTVKANSGVHVTYQWYRNDEAISGATQSWYSPAMLNAGKYSFYCVINCSGYLITSEPYHVIIDYMNTQCKTPSVTAEYGQLLEEIVPENPAGNTPGTWVWVRPTDFVGDVGQQFHLASFIPNDTAAYEAVYNLTVAVTVLPAQRTLAFAEGYSLDKTYDGKAAASPSSSALVLDGPSGGTLTYKWYKAGSDVALARAPIDVGDYTVEATLSQTRNASAAAATLPVTISPKEVDLSDGIRLANDADAVYTGEAVTPDITVWDGDQLVSDREYTVQFSDNIDAGENTARVTIVDQPGGNYILSGTSTFTIAPRTLVVTGAQAADKEYDGKRDVILESVELSGAIPGADVYVDCSGNDMIAEVAVEADQNAAMHPDVGEYRYVRVQRSLALSGADAGNYQLPPSDNNVPLSEPVSIQKAPLPQMEMTQEISVRYRYQQVGEYEYQWSLGQFRANVSAPMRSEDAVAFTADSTTLGEKYYATNAGQTTIENNIIRVKTRIADDAPIGPAGDLFLTAKFKNYQDTPCVIHISANNKITATIEGVEFIDSQVYSGEPVVGYNNGASDWSIHPTEGEPLTAAEYKIIYTGRGETSYFSSTPPVDAGSYQVNISIPETDQNYIGLVWGNFEIEKADTVYIEPETNTLVYTGKPQVLMKVGSSAQGAMLYSDSENGVYTNQVPTAVDAGPHTVWYKVQGDRNHKDTAPASLTVNIQKADVTVASATAAAKVYDGTADVEITAIQLSGVAEGDDAQIDLGEQMLGTVVAEGHPNAGTYTQVTLPALQLVGESVHNYTLHQPEGAVPLSPALQIEKMPMAPINAEEQVLNYYPHTYSWSLEDLCPDLGALGEYDQVTEYTLKEVSLDEAYYDTGACITGSDLQIPIKSVDTEECGAIGTVKVALSFRNHETITCTITLYVENKQKLQITGVTGVESVTYTGEAVTGYTGEPSSLYKDEYEIIYDTGSEPPTDVGAHHVTIRIPETDPNYYGSVSFDFTIEKAMPEVTAPQAISDLVENGEPQTLVTEGSTSNGTMLYALQEDGPYAAEIPTGEKAGDYTVWYKVQGDDHYQDTAPASVSVTIAPAPYQVTIPEFADGSVETDTAAAPAGTSITLTVKPDDGYALGQLTVTDESGKQVELNKQDETTYTFTMPASSVTVAAKFQCDGSSACPTHSFTDLDMSKWYHAAVDFVLKQNLMQGVGDGKFAPERLFSRAMLVQILYNKAGRPAVEKTDAFTDVRDSDWFSDAVAWASKRGIVNGYGDGKFGPDDSITREQLVTMLWRDAGKPAADQDELQDCPDAGDVSQYAAEAVNWAVGRTIIRGYTDGRIKPKNLATRAEAAQMLLNCFG